MLKKIFLIFALTILSYSATPRPLIQVSYHLGGDELVTIDHDYKADYTIDAGDGLTQLRHQIFNKALFHGLF